MKSFQTSDTVTWTMRKKWFYTLVVAEIIVLLAALTMIGWGYYQHWEVDRLREENELHQRQGEIANQKLTVGCGSTSNDPRLAGGNRAARRRRYRSA